jgi:hypothetical protein
VATVRPFERVVVCVMGERLVAVAKVLSVRLWQELRKFSRVARGYLQRTEFPETVRNERVKDAERVLETMEDFRECMRLNGKLSESRNRRRDPQFSERFSNSAPTAIRSFFYLLRRFEFAMDV